MSTSDAQAGNLQHDELEDLVRWFIHTMPADQRGRLMADRPQLYARLYPGVDPTIILDKVARGMRVPGHVVIAAESKAGTVCAMCGAPDGEHNYPCDDAPDPGQE